VIFCETSHHTQAHVTSGILCPFFGRKNTGSRAVSWFHWPLFVVATSAQAGCCCVPLLPQNSLLTLLTFTPDSEAMSATRISLMASSSSFIYFFWPLLETHHHLPCLDYYVWLGSFRNIIPVRYEHHLQWQQNRSKSMMWLLYKNCSYSRVPKTLLLDWRLYIAFYYSTTPTDYPCTTRGMSVGPSVAVNIEFCGYFQFFSTSFVLIIWVQYTTDNLSGQQLEFA